MKSFIAILLASAFLFQSASKLLVVVDYAMHKDFIAKNLCENKAKPKMHCNGKCHLKKQLQKEDKKEGQNQNSSKEKIEVQYFSEKTNAVFIVTKQIELNSVYLSKNYVSPLISIFHPPQLIS